MGGGRKNRGKRDAARCSILSNGFFWFNWGNLCLHSRARRRRPNCRSVIAVHSSQLLLHARKCGKRCGAVEFCQFVAPQKSPLHKGQENNASNGHEILNIRFSRFLGRRRHNRIQMSIWCSPRKDNFILTDWRTLNILTFPMQIITPASLVFARCHFHLRLCPNDKEQFRFLSGCTNT